jgi:hypothetical protein
VFSSALSRRQVGPGGHLRPPAGPRADPTALPRAGRAPVPSPVGPRAEAASGPYKAAASPAPLFFFPNL